MFPASAGRFFTAEPPGKSQGREAYTKITLIQGRTRWKRQHRYDQSASGHGGGDNISDLRELRGVLFLEEVAFVRKTI